MNFKYPFVFLAGIVIIAGLTPFALSQQGLVEPAMEIDMLAGQSQYPLRIQNSTDHNVFAITPEGGISPRPTVQMDTQFDEAIMDEIAPLWHYSTPNQIITTSAQSGVGIYEYTYTLTADDLAGLTEPDSRGMFTALRYVPFVSIQMENIGVGAITANIEVYDANTDVDIAGGAYSDLSVASGNFLQFKQGDSWTGNYLSNANLESYQWEVGDTIGFKIWTDTPNDLRLNVVAIWGIPDLRVDAVSISFKNPHTEVAEFGENHEGDTSCPYTTCNENFDIFWSMWEHGDNLESLYGDSGMMTEGSVWYNDLSQGQLLETASDQIYRVSFKYFNSYPNSVSLVTWK